MRGSKRARRITAGLVGLVVSLGLAACTSGGGDAGGGQAGPSTTVTPTAKQAKVAIAAEGGDQVNPRTPIVVKVTDGTLNTVTVTNPQTGNHVEGTKSADNSTWTSKDHLRFGATYEVVATAVNTDGKPTEQKSTVHTLAAAAQALPELFPGTDHDYGVGQPIGVRFDRDVDKAAAEKALIVTATPAQPGSWHWLSNREVHYRPKDYWQPNTTVKVDANLFGVNLGGGVYGQDDRTATYKIHDSWVAKADGGTHKMQILHNNQPVTTMDISMGMPSQPSHSGSHVVSEKAPKVRMTSCSYDKSRCTPGQNGYYDAVHNWGTKTSTDGEYVHELMASYNSGAQGHQNVSNGCINLTDDLAKWFFDRFNPGDVVEVTNSGGKPIDNSSGLDWGTDWALDWPAWQAGSALRG